jgi:hypothetical protein
MFFAKIKLSLLFILILITPSVLNAALSCSVSATCNAPDVTLFKMSGTTNAHAELPGQSNYSNLVCCTGVTGIGNSCSGTYATALKLSAPTNAHVEESTQSNYIGNNACLSIASGTVSVGYQSTNCSGYDTTVASISGVTSAHVGDGSAYTTKVCATAQGSALTFTLSDNSIGFGSLSSSSARYATGDSVGSASEVEAHTLSVAASSTNGYLLSVQGATLTSGGNTVTAIGNTNSASSVGTEQFGLRLTATGGTGVVSTPYDGSGFAYNATAATQSQVASATSGDGVTTTYSARYLANTAATTEPGSYTANITYLLTVQF